jgi:hypothetical protein
MSPNVPEGASPRAGRQEEHLSVPDVPGPSPPDDRAVAHRHHGVQDRYRYRNGKVLGLIRHMHLPQTRRQHVTVSRLGQIAMQPSLDQPEREDL